MLKMSHGTTNNTIVSKIMMSEYPTTVATAVVHDGWRKSDVSIIVPFIGVDKNVPDILSRSSVTEGFEL